MNLFTPAETAANYAIAGGGKTKLSFGKMFVLGMLAGVLIALGAAVTNTASHSLSNVGVIRIVSGLMFPFGLAMVILMGAELFTGNCLILISVLDKKTTFGGMIKNWAVVYAGNFAGAVLTAAACVYSGQLGYSDGGLAVFSMKVAVAKCALPFGKAFVLGVMCNVLVTVGVLLSLSAKNLAGRVLGAYMPVCFFVICGFEHSVANMFYVPVGLLAKTVPAYVEKAAAAGLDISGLTWGNFLFSNLLPVTIGNIIGGVAVGALVWFAWLSSPEKQA